jgi:hypothetical protein
MSSKLRGPTTSLGTAVLPSVGTPPIGAPMADPQAEIEAATERFERWAEMARRVAVPRRGESPHASRFKHCGRATET